MRQAFERTLRNDFDELGDAARAVCAELQRFGVEPEIVHAVDLALEELVSNTIRHGCSEGNEHEIRISVVVEPHEVRVTLRDDALPFDPTRAGEPPRPTTIADTPLGGRGISMVRRLIRDMRYRRAGNENALELVLPRRPSGPPR